MAAQSRVICASSALEEAGKGVRFVVTRQGEERPAFVVRHGGKVYGYLNRCAHVSVELDWEEGAFFDYSGTFLVCSTHGAAYRPESGYCFAGPCKGKHLTPVNVEEHDGQIWLNQEE